jgi:hypothetical protein
VLEEVRDLLAHDRRQIAIAADSGVERMQAVDRHGEYLLVSARLVLHQQRADRPTADHGAANDWLDSTPLWEGRIGASKVLTCSFEEAAQYSRARREGLALWRGSFARDSFGWVAPPVLNPYTRMAVEMNPTRGIMRVVGYERPESEDDSLRSAIASFYTTEARYADLLEYTTSWIRRNPKYQSAYQTHLSALVNNDQVEAANSLAERWMKEAQLEGKLPAEVRTRLDVALNYAFGQTVNMYSNQIDERWFASTTPATRLACWWCRTAPSAPMSRKRSRRCRPPPWCWRKWSRRDISSVPTRCSRSMASVCCRCASTSPTPFRCKS